MKKNTHLGLGVLTSAMLAMSAPAADEPTVDATGVWYGTHESRPSAGALRRTLYVLSLEAQGEELTGSLTIATPPSGTYAYAALRSSAMASLGVAPPNRLLEFLLELPPANPITGSLVRRNVTIASVPSPMGSQITAEGKIIDDRTRLTLSVGPVSRKVQLRRCAPAANETLAEACSIDALWRTHIERSARTTASTVTTFPSGDYGAIRGTDAGLHPDVARQDALRDQRDAIR